MTAKATALPPLPGEGTFSYESHVCNASERRTAVETGDPERGQD